MNSKGKGVIAAAVMICVVLFIGMCLFIASFSIVEPTYMAISRNKMSSRIDDQKVYFEGRHFLGVANEFIKYPMGWQLVEYTDDNVYDNSTGQVDFICKIEEAPLDAATSEGLTVSVELSLYFTIPPQQLINFYTTYSTNYQDSIANECKKVLKDCVTKFTTNELFSARVNISNTMRDYVGKALSRRRCILQKLLLRGITFSDSLENEIERSVVQDQSKTQEEFKGQIRQIEAEKDALRKNYTELINRVLSEADREATVIIQQARAEANSLLAQSTAQAWGTYQDTTGLEASDLLKVQWARSLGASGKGDTIVLGYDKVGSGFVQPVKSV